MTVVQRDKKGHQWTIVTNKAAIDEANRKNLDIQSEAAHGNANAQRQSEEANAEAQRKWADSNKAIQDAHDAELKTADAAIAAAQAKLNAVPPAPATDVSDTALVDAQHRVDDARAANPMYQVAAAWLRIPVQKLDPEHFEVVKHWAVIGLSGAAATAAALTAIVAALSERPYTPSKLKIALRAWLAARRKTLRRIEETIVEVPGPERLVEVVKEVEVPGPERVVEKEVVREVAVPGPVTIKEVEVIKEVAVPGPERVVEVPVPGPERVVERMTIKWLPYDMATGRRIKPDGTLGEVTQIRSAS